MTPTDFRAWRATMGCTQQQAALALGVSLRTIKAWEGGETAVPAIVPLACEALAARSATGAVPVQSVAARSRS